MIKKFYDFKNLKAHLAPEDSILNEAWKRLIEKWEKIG
jgi:hypothetical protein